MQRDDQKRDLFKIAKGLLRILLVTRILTMVCWQSVMKIENKRKKTTLWPLFMDGVQLPQGYTAITRRQFTF